MARAIKKKVKKKAKKKIIRKTTMVTAKAECYKTMDVKMHLIPGISKTGDRPCCDRLYTDGTNLMIGAFNKTYKEVGTRYGLTTIKEIPNLIKLLEKIQAEAIDIQAKIS